MTLIKIIIFAAIIYFGWHYFNSPQGQQLVQDVKAKVQEVAP